MNALESWVKKGKDDTKKVHYAQILLNWDENQAPKSSTLLKDVIGMGVKTIERVGRRFCQEGKAMFTLQARKPRCDKQIEGREQAHLSALLCQSWPDGKSRWALRMLSDKVIELQVDHNGKWADKKNQLKPFQKQQWVIPPEKRAAFVYQLEEVLWVYEGGDDAAFRVVSLEESAKQVLDYKERVGQDGKHYQDWPYSRKGGVQLLVATQPGGC